MKRIFDGAETKLVNVEVYKDDNLKPVFKGTTMLKLGSMLSFTTDVTAFIGEEAEYGDLCRYRVVIKPYRKGVSR